MASALDVAKYLIRLSYAGEEPDGLTHLRLQKLLYYAQGWHLALTGRPLFLSRIEAWDHGPVARDLYSVFTHYENAVIPLSEGDEPLTLATEEEVFLRVLWEEYKRYSASALRQMTHDERPWQEAFAKAGPRGLREHVAISEQDLKEFFTSLAESKAIPGLSPASAYRGVSQLERGNTRTHEEVFARLHQG